MNIIIAKFNVYACWLYYLLVVIQFPALKSDQLTFSSIIKSPFVSFGPSGRPLFHMGLRLLQKHDLINELKLDILKVMKFLGKLSSSLMYAYCN